MNNILWFDIQTCPECLTEEAWYSYEKRTAWERKAETNPDIDGTFKSYTKRAYIYPEFSRVVSIAFKDEGKLIYWDAKEGGERDLLLKINEFLKRKECRIGGFNIYGFDIPFLWKRMVINKIAPCNRISIDWIKPRDLGSYVVDVMQLWKQTSFTCSLDLLCLSLFGEKPNVDDAGEFIAGAVNSGTWDWVKYYNEEALEFTERCYDAIMYPDQRDDGEEKTLEEKKQEAKDIAEKKMEKEGEEVAKEGVELPF